MDGQEQLAGIPQLSACRAPTDNDRNIQFRWLQKNEWQGENLDKASTKVYSCAVEGDAIVLSASLSGISREPVFRYSMKLWIRQDGTIDLDLHGTVREDTIYLPRLGFEFVLPGDSDHFIYYGNGPAESYRDLCHAGSVGLHRSDAASEYVNYVRPQEHGNHTDVKMVQLGKLVFSTDRTMEIQVSRYSCHALLAAEHTDELAPDGKTHLRIDYKVSGIGSNSCGPELEKAYRLEEKEISFQFSIRPISEGGNVLCS